MTRKKKTILINATHTKEKIHSLSILLLIIIAINLD